MTSDNTNRGPGRPRSPLTLHLPRVRCSPRQLERWRAAADKDGRTSFGDWVRRALNREAARTERRRS